MATSFLSRKPDSGLGNIRSSPGSPGRNIDWVLMTVQFGLTIIGGFVVYSASHTRVTADPYYYATRQVVFAIIGAVVMFVVMGFDYESWRDRARFLYGFTLVLLLMLFLLGVVSGQDRISFDLCPFNFQPAEMAKVALIFWLAYSLSKKRERASLNVSLAALTLFARF